METILTVVGFILFSVLMDALEGRRKKKRQTPPPEPQAEPQCDERRAPRPPRPAPAPVKAKAPSPEAKAFPQPRPRPQTHLSAPPAEPSAAADSVAAAATETRHFPDAGQLYSNALLDAVAYAEILQPPKAYQYMKKRSCIRHWPDEQR